MSPLALSLLVLAALVHTAWNLALKRAEDRLLFSALAFALGSLVCAPVLFFTPGLDPRTLGLAVLSAGFNVAYFVTLTRAYGLADFSFVYPVARGVAPLLLTLLAWVSLGERPGPAGLAGLALLLGGLAVLAGVGGAKRPERSATLAALSVAVLIAAYSFVDGVAARRADPLHYTVLNNALGAVGLLGLVLRRRGVAAARSLLLARPVALALTGAGMVGGYALVVSAFALAPLGYVGAVRECSVVFGALAGWLWLGEPLGARRVGAATLMFLGIVVLMRA